MGKIIGYEKIWEGNIDIIVLEEIIESGQPLYFRYNNNDYLIEADSGYYMIVDPFKYYVTDIKPQEPDFAYPYHNKAESAEEFYLLPFLDGRTILERLNELVFFDISAVYDSSTE